jgi:hypothetical protein
MRGIKREIVDFQIKDCGVQIFEMLFILKWRIYSLIKILKEIVLLKILMSALSSAKYHSLLTYPKYKVYNKCLLCVLKYPNYNYIKKYPNYIMLKKRKKGKASTSTSLKFNH